jgi:hypothetical protein
VTGRISLSLVMRAALVVLATLVCWQPAKAQGTTPFKNLEDYVKWVKSKHKLVPFERDGSELPQGAAKALKERATAAVAAAVAQSQNDRVTQDKNPWPKAEVAAAVDPTNGRNYVVMSNDFRLNFDHMFFHSSTDGGETFTDDSMVGGSDPVTGLVPFTFQSDPGVSFDRAGNSYLSTITGNLIFDFNSGYENMDTEIEVAQGAAHGTYASLLPTPIDDQPCSGLFGSTFTCNAVLDKPLITTDNSGTASDGTTYVYYTLFCQNSPRCSDGSATEIAPGSSVILESHSAGAGLPFTAPALVSGALANAQFSDMVVDSAGTPHIFFDDFTNFPVIHMWLSTLKGGKWVVSHRPAASFIFNGLGNVNWAFRDSGAEAPGCGIHGVTAYCAFSANQVSGGRLEGSPSVYLAIVDTATGASSVTRVNSDPFGDSKHHFFAWATATPSGAVYVGWYDDRNDPFNTKVQYFVGKSTDGGKTFPVQKAVSDTAFDPCTGFPGCAFFGDYVQLVSGSDGVVHAAWSDTRDGASMQIWSEAISW